MKIIIKRLPDINSYMDLPGDYADYGRFGMTRSGRFYMLGIHSSHPADTETGGYWAVNSKGDVLYLSARGCSEGFESFVKFIIDKGYIDRLLKN